MAGNGEKEILESGVSALTLAGIPLGVIGTWLAAIFRYGRRVGVLEANIRQHEEDIAGLEEKLGVIEAEWKSEMRDMMEPISKAIDEIRGQFFTSDNEPRLMSYKAHDKIQQACQLHILAEIGHIVSAVGKFEGKLDTVESAIKSEVAELRKELVNIRVGES